MKKIAIQNLCFLIFIIATMISAGPVLASSNSITGMGQKTLSLCRNVLLRSVGLKANRELTETMLFDIFRGFGFLPNLPPRLSDLKLQLSKAEQNLLIEIHENLNHSPFSRADVGSPKKIDLISKLEKLGIQALDSNAPILSLDFTLSQKERERAESLTVPLFEGGKFWLNGTRGSSDFVGYHQFESKNGEKFISLLPLHEPYTHKFTSKGKVKLPRPPPITVEEIIEMHKFIAERAVMPEAIAQVRGVHYVGTELRVLYEIIVNDKIGEFLSSNPSAKILKQAGQILVPERFDGKRFTRFDDMQGDYMRIKDQMIRIGVPVRVLQFNEEVRNGEVIRLKDSL